MSPPTFLLFLLSGFSIPLLSQAQYGSPSSASSSSASSSPSSTSASPTPTTSGSTHDVDVGKSGFAFSPNNLTAAIGDRINFHFYPTGHSVAQSTFDSPCVPMAGSFYSGFMNAQGGEADQMFTITINSTAPTWLYCTQVTHCQSGMAMVVNPPSTGPNTLAAYIAAAKNAPQSQSPPAVGGGVLAKNQDSDNDSGDDNSSSSSSSSSSSGSGGGSATSTASGTTTASSAAATGAGVRRFGFGDGSFVARFMVVVVGGLGLAWGLGLGVGI